MRRAPSFHARMLPAKSLAMIAYSVEPSSTEWRKAACSARPIAACGTAGATGVLVSDTGAPGGCVRRLRIQVRCRQCFRGRSAQPGAVRRAEAARCEAIREGFAGRGGRSCRKINVRGPGRAAHPLKWPDSRCLQPRTQMTQHSILLVEDNAVTRKAVRV